MKVAILHSGDLEKVSPGGISQYIEKIIKYNDKNDITIFGTIDSKSDYEIGIKYEKYIGDKIYKFIPISNNNRRPLSIFYFINLFKYFRELRKYDVIYAQRMEYALPFTFNKLKNKLVMAVHGSGAYSYIFWGKFIGTIYNLLERLAIKNSKKVIVLLKRKEYGVPYYKKKYKRDQEKIIYGKVPIDLDIFKKMESKNTEFEQQTKKSKNTIIYFGRIDDNPKRILLLPRIIEILTEKERDIKCIVIGDGNDKEKLKDIIKEKGLNEKFSIIDKLNHGDELVKKINLADLSIILSSFEGICMSALESLACGVPVIATDVGDIKEYINNGYNGKIVHNSDDEEKLINDLSLAIYESLEKKIKTNNVYISYEGNKVITELENIFLDIVKNNKSGI